MKKRLLNIAKYLQLLIFVCYYGSATLFLHVHDYNGVKTWHSHPFSQENHKHTADQLALINLLTNFFLLPFVAGICLKKFLPKLLGKIAFALIDHTKKSQDYSCCSLRAPPAFSL